MIDAEGCERGNHRDQRDQKRCEGDEKAKNGMIGRREDREMREISERYEGCQRSDERIGR